MNSKIFTFIVLGMIANNLYANDIEGDLYSISFSTSSESITPLEKATPLTANFNLEEDFIDVSQILAFLQENQDVFLTFGDQKFSIIPVTMATVIDDDDISMSSSSISSSSSSGSSSSLEPITILAIPDDTTSPSALENPVTTATSASESPIAIPTSDSL